MANVVGTGSFSRELNRDYVLESPAQLASIISEIYRLGNRTHPIVIFCPDEHQREAITLKGLLGEILGKDTPINFYCGKKFESSNGGCYFVDLGPYLKTWLGRENLRKDEI